MAKSKSTIYISSEDDSPPRHEKSKRYLDRILDDLSSDDDTQQASSSPFKSMKRASKARSEALQGFRKTAKSAKFRGQADDFPVKTVVIMPDGLDEDNELLNPVVPDENDIARLRKLKLAAQNHTEGIRFKKSWTFRETNEFVASLFKELVAFLGWEKGKEMPWVFCGRRSRKLLLCADEDLPGEIVEDFARKNKKSSWTDSKLIFVLRSPLDLAEYESWLNGDDASSLTETETVPLPPQTVKGKGKQRAKRSPSPGPSTGVKVKRLRRNSDSEPSSSNILLPDDTIDEYPPNQLMLGVGSSKISGDNQKMSDPEVIEKKAAPKYEVLWQKCQVIEIGLSTFLRWTSALILSTSPGLYSPAMPSDSTEVSQHIEVAANSSGDVPVTLSSAPVANAFGDGAVCETTRGPQGCVNTSGDDPATATKPAPNTDRNASGDGSSTETTHEPTAGSVDAPIIEATEEIEAASRTSVNGPPTKITHAAEIEENASGNSVPAVPTHEMNYELTASGADDESPAEAQDGLDDALSGSTDDLQMVLGRAVSPLHEGDLDKLEHELYSIYVSRSLTGKGGGLALTPLGASVAYFSSPDTWQSHILQSVGINADSLFSEESIASLLFRNVRRHETQLKRSLLEASSASSRTFARHAFRGNLERTTQSEFLHAFLQLIVADRFAWTLRERPEHDDRPLPRPHMFPGSIKDSEKHKEVYDLAIKWNNTLADFLEVWQTYRPENVSVQQPVQQPRPPPAKKGRKVKRKAIKAPEPAVDDQPVEISYENAEKQKASILTSLVGGVVDAESRLKLAKVQDNFCQAALGVFALAQREAMRPADDDGYDETPLVQIVQEFYKDLPQTLRELDDYSFLRPLYIATAISPVCLLAPMQYSSSSRCRLGLSQILKGMNVTALQPHDQRRDIEYDLMKTIFKMAIGGRDSFEPSMSASMTEWESKNIIKDGKTLIDASQIQKADLRIEWQKMQEESPPSLLMVQALASRVEPPKTKRRHWEVIDLNMDTPEKWIVESVQSAVKRKSESEIDNDSSQNSNGTGARKRRKGVVENEQTKKLSTAEELALFEREEPQHDREAFQALIKHNEEERERVRKMKAAAKRKKRRRQRKDEAEDEIEDETGDEIEEAGQDPKLRSDLTTDFASTKELTREFRHDPATPSTNITLKFTVKIPGHPSSTSTELVPFNRSIPEPAATTDTLSFEAAEVSDFKEVTHTIPIWQSMKEMTTELETLKLYTDRRVEDPQTRLQTFSRARWDSLTYHQRRECFQRGAIHVVGVPSSRPYGLKGISDPKLSNLIALHVDRQCIDLTLVREENTLLDTVMKRMTVAEFLCDLRDRKEDKGNLHKRRCCNMLDIPLLHNCLPLPSIREFDDFSKYAHSNPAFWLPKTELGLDGLASQWALAGHTSAYSRVHIDAAGFASYVYLLEGTKAWWIARDNGYRLDENGFNISKMAFDCVYLSEGDELYLPPNTPHAVLTLEDSFALGGHFYCSQTLDRSLQALVDEHFFGTVITNAQHTRAPLVLMKALADLVVGNESLIRRTYSLEELADLVILVNHLFSLAPEIPVESPEPSWQETEEFDLDMVYIQVILLELVDRLRMGNFQSLLMERMERLKKQVEHNRRFSDMEFTYKPIYR
ncbi:hypothetical protein ACEPAH_2600 [Sanghuangporus vaninii]